MGVVMRTIYEKCEPMTLLSLDWGVVVPDFDCQRSQFDRNRGLEDTYPSGLCQVLACANDVA